MVDYTTNFFNISQLPDKLSSMVAIHAKHLFSKYGIPKVVISDNGPEFTANTFKTFLKQWDYPKSNGQIERTIQTIKKSIKKALKGNDDPPPSIISHSYITRPKKQHSTSDIILQPYNKNLTTLNE